MVNALRAGDERVFAEHHFGGCPGCAAYLDQVRETIRVAGALRADDLSPNFLEGLAAAFRSWEAGTAP